ncbi:hypothetical protein C8R44DRAFT_743139 [Mycena epipterygia]|nr:hypothetical protein C8R44DRAFT_743139 [Mycena epipterygia]
MTIRFPDSGSGRGVQLRYTHSERHLPFPRHSRGFLYYSSEPHRAPIEASVRFRLTPDETPASFLRGQDLLAPWALPWQITLLQIATLPRYLRIREQILHEGMVTEDQLSHCRHVFRKHSIFPQYTLFRLEQPFLANFSGSMSLTAVGETLHPFILNPFRVLLPKQYFAWSGSALVRFEPSTQPKHAGRRVVHMRIVKIVQPVVRVEGHTARLDKPEEGQLLTVSLHSRDPGPWAYDIDGATKPASALRVLWDNSGLP